MGSMGAIMFLLTATALQVVMIFIGANPVYRIAINPGVQITSFPAYGYLYGNNKLRGPRRSQQKL
jgi:hypothetical protein